jgi:tRNA-(ms[2]io[6]A)-hydroxylase
MSILGLKLATDPRWANIAESNIEGILSDHAWCEQKAASNAISLITSNPDKPDLVRRLTEIAIEEMEHFQMVIDIIKERNLSLHPENKDDYVNHLYKFMKRGEGKDQSLVDRLLFAAMIEARSCERFKVLSENIQDQELAKFYRDLMISEAEHYTTFITFAREFGGRVDVDQRWKEWLEFEDNLIRSYGVNQTIHG